MTLPKKLKFLKSLRFWKLFVVAITQFLATQGIIIPELAATIAILLGGSVAIRTIDKIGENIGPKEDRLDRMIKSLPQIEVTPQSVEEKNLHNPKK